MTKKYRLEIPEMIRKDLLTKAVDLKEFDGEIIEYKKDLRGDYQYLFPLGVPGHFQVVYPPKEWLKEIKQPITKEDGCDRYFNSIFPNHKINVDDGTMESYKLAYIEGWEDCEENERLKHELKCDHDWIVLHGGSSPEPHRHICSKCGMEVPF